RLVERQRRVSVEDWYGERLRVGVLSDTHLGSLYFMRKLLEAAYKTFKRESVDAILHCGDMTAGEKMYKGQEYELYAHGFDAQRDEVINTYPECDGVPTRFITGNHDLSYWKRTGADIGEAIAERRADMIYLGMEEHDLQLGGLRLRLSHPGKGTAYALCYSEDTRILTRDRSWQLISALEDSDAVATLNPETNRLEWQLPTARPTYDYSGPMIQVGGSPGYSYDLLVTPSHQMWVARPWGANNTGRRRSFSPPGFHFVRAEEITAGRQYKLQRWAHWDGTEEA
ncbi:unnamed protein product, partial [marine sediment metagenome]